MPVIKCKMCGGDLNIVEDSTVCECEYCGTKQTVPKVDDEKKLKLFERANRLRTACEFDKAAGVYESIVADFDEEAEAYWGLILCKFGIEYVDDPATGNKIPTCRRSSFDSLMDDPNFDMVMECADPLARKVYREEAKQIEELRKRIIEVSSQEEPYDAFISYKELDDEGQRTLDSVIAQDIYSELTERGYRVFFSRISLEDKLGVEYEPYIFAALNSAKVMLVVGTDYDYFNAVWVKNEWSRFLMLIASGQKKTLIPVFKGIDAYDMPKEFRKLAAQDMGKVGAMQDLIRGVEKLLGKGGTAEAPKEQPLIVQSSGPNVSALLDRGYISLEDSDWSKAQELFDQVLNMDSRNAEAYLGLAMVEEKCRDREAFHMAFVDPDSKCKNNKRLSRVRQFGSAELLSWLQTLDAEAETQIKAKQEAELKAAEAERQAKLEAAKSLRIQREKRKAARTMIAAGRNHTVGLKADGSVVAVGGTYQGHCNVSGWTDIVAVATGISHTVGLKTDGSVVAVGYNSDGQCNVSDWTDIVAVAAGGWHTVGLKADGTVVAVGQNGNGLCNVSGWTDIVVIAAGDDHTVGLKADGTVVAVGYNDNGQCNVSGWTDIVAIAVGNYHTVGLKADGSVVAVGDNYYGQCEVSGWTDIVAVTAGILHTVSLKVDGSVVAVGDNEFGQCEVGDWTDIVAIAAGYYHTVGLRADGTVIATEYKGKQEYNYGQCDVSGWKLFNNFETIETERKAAAEKAEAERKAAAEKAEAERKAAAEKAEAERKAAAEKAEAERKAKIAALKKEQLALQTEHSNLHGLFTGMRRREIEERLSEIEAELKKLQ